jgi:N-acylneuraminate cytidylyltransferase
MGNLAVIPARGGSKRIPRKNIKDFLGKPILAYSIEAALESGLFDEVMVSTDDEEIAGIAEELGAQVPFIRSVGHSTDYSTTLDVLKEVENDYKVKQNRSFDFVCCIYATAPLITKTALIEGLELLKKESLNSVFPVVEFSYPIWRGVEISSGKIKMVWPEHLNSRSQDLRTVYHDAGQWYWYNPNKITDSLFTDHTASVILKEQEVQDIDTEIDWKLAEIKYQLLNGQ